MKNRKRGFSLVEVIVVVAMLAIISAFVIPQFGSPAEKSRLKSDASWAQKVEDAAKLAATNQKTYYKLSSCIEKRKCNAIVITYAPNPDGKMEYTEAEFGEVAGGMLSPEEIGNVETYLNSAANDIKNYIDGTVEPYQVQSSQHKKEALKISIYPGDSENQLKVTSEWTTISSN